MADGLSVKLIGVGLADEVQVTLTANIEIPPDLPQAIRDDARSRIMLVLNRESQRLAEIVLVDARDAEAAPAELARIRAADPNRSHVIVGAGTRDAVIQGKIPVEDVVQVIKGSITAAGKELAAKGQVE